MLSRAQRRRQEKEAKKKDKKIMMSHAELHQTIGAELEKMKSDALHYAVNAMVAAFVISLHDEYGFGPKRLNTLLAKVNNQFDCIGAGTVTLEDFASWCKEYGVNIDMREKV